MKTVKAGSSILDFARLRALRLAVQISLAGALVTSALVAYLNVKFYQERLTYAAQAVESTLAQSLLLGDKFQLNKMVTSLKRNSDVVAVAVVDDKSGQTVAEEVAQGNTLPLSTGKDGLSLHGGILHGLIVLRFPIMNGNEPVGHLAMAFRPPVDAIASSLLLVFLTFLAFSLLLIRAARRAALQLAGPIAEFSENLMTVTAREQLDDLYRKPLPFKELQQVQTGFESLLGRMQEIEAREKRALKDALVAQIATQVRHDVKQALMASSAALKKLMGRAEDMALMTASLRRIESTINDIPKFKIDELKAKTKVTETHELRPVHVASLLSPLVYELEMLIQSGKRRIDAEFLFEDADFDVFIEVEPTRIRRVIANVFANALDAIEGQGKITLGFRRDGAGSIIISVTDNGKGIPADIIAKIGQPGFSHGKPSGNGLGLSSAIEFVKTWHGQLLVSSIESNGTTIDICLPEAAPDHLFLSGLVIPRETEVVLLDDDPTVHEIWRRRLRGRTTKPAREIFNTNEAEAVVNELKLKGAPFLLLADYDLGPESESGLEFIKRKALCNQSVLVSNNVDDVEVIAKCRHLGVSVIPKSVQTLVPIS